VDSDWFDALQFHDFEDFGHFVIFAFDLVDKILQKFIAVKVDVSLPVIFCHVPIFIEVKKPKKLLALLFIDITGNFFACIPHIVFHQDHLIRAWKGAEVLEWLNNQK
jgi:hypothetical protein